MCVTLYFFVGDEIFKEIGVNWMKSICLLNNGIRPDYYACVLDALLDNFCRVTPCGICE